MFIPHNENADENTFFVFIVLILLTFCHWQTCYYHQRKAGAGPRVGQVPWKAMAATNQCTQ